MFLKVLKYDFSFSVRIFAALAAILLAVALVMRFTMPMFAQAEDIFALVALQYMVLPILVVGVAIASITQIFQFFNRNFFGHSGYLTLTLPVGRLKLIVSKIIVSMVWFNFMMAAVAGAMFILLDSLTRELRGVSILSRIGLNEVLMLVEVNLLAIVAITVLFLALTLARTVVGGRRIHGIIAGVLAGGFGSLYLVFNNLLSQRSVETITQEIFRDAYATWTVPSIGLRYGRIPLGDAGNFLDIFQIGMGLGLAVIAAGFTYYLVKRRVALRY